MSVIGYVAVSFTSYYVEIFATLSTALTGKIITGISSGKRNNRGWLYKERAKRSRNVIFGKGGRREDLKLLETRFFFRTNDVTGCVASLLHDGYFMLYIYNINNGAGILTHDLKFYDIAVAVAFDVAGNAGVISGLGPIHLSESQIVLLNYHAVLCVILNHVSLKQCAFAIRSKCRRNKVIISRLSLLLFLLIVSNTIIIVIENS